MRVTAGPASKNSQDTEKGQRFWYKIKKPLLFIKFIRAAAVFAAHAAASANEKYILQVAKSPVQNPLI